MFKVTRLSNSEIIGIVVTAAAKNDQETLDKLRAANVLSAEMFNKAVANGQVFAQFASQYNAANSL